MNITGRKAGSPHPTADAATFPQRGTARKDRKGKSKKTGKVIAKDRKGKKRPERQEQKTKI